MKCVKFAYISQLAYGFKLLYVSYLHVLASDTNPTRLKVYLHIWLNSEHVHYQSHIARMILKYVPSALAIMSYCESNLNTAQLFLLRDVKSHHGCRLYSHDQFLALFQKL